jgi:hypothetical protein
LAIHCANVVLVDGTPKRWLQASPDAGATDRASSWEPYVHRAGSFANTYQASATGTLFVRLGQVVFDPFTGEVLGGLAPTTGLAFDHWRGCFVRLIGSRPIRQEAVKQGGLVGVKLPGATAKLAVQRIVQLFPEQLVFTP